jgi:hypothetical protein
MLLTIFVLGFLLPLAASAAIYFSRGAGAGWQTADRSSAGLLPAAADKREAVVRVYAARTVRWRGIFAVHSWIVFKDRDAGRYTRYDYTAWGQPVRENGFIPDGRWFGQIPDTVFAADGAEAERLIPKIRAAIEAYRLTEIGDYRAWPGPNSNTFIAAILDAVPEIGVTLPPTAIGRDYPYGRGWIGLTPSRSGVRATLGGYAGVTLGWREGIEVNLLGAVLGLDIRRPAIKLPGIGRIGLPASA